MYFEIGGGLPRLPRLPRLSTLGVSLLPLKVKTRARANPALRVNGLGALGILGGLGIEEIHGEINFGSSKLQQLPAWFAWELMTYFPLTLVSIYMLLGRRGDGEAHQEMQVLPDTHQVPTGNAMHTYSLPDRSESHFICYQCWIVLSSTDMITPAFNRLRLAFPNISHTQAL